MAPEEGTSKGYLQLPVLLSPSAPVYCYLNIRKHEKSETDEATLIPGRTLFVAGLPHGCDEKQLDALFSNFGKVEAVEVDTIGKVNTAHVVFETPQGIKKALNSAKGQIPVSEPLKKAKEVAGMTKWIAQYRQRRPGSEMLQHQMSTWLVEWEAEQEREKEALEAAAQAEADDGWTLVTAKKGRQKTQSSGGTAVGAISAAKTASIGAQAAEKDAKKRAQLADFYRFQRREKARDDLMELRQKFAEDKEKIAKLREARRFKPY